MRRLLLCGLMGTAGVLSQGCALTDSQPSARCGFRFEIIKPPLVLNTPTATVLTTDPAAVDLTHLGNTALPAAIPPHATQALPQMRMVPAVPGKPMSIAESAYYSAGCGGTASACDWSTLCAKLDRMIELQTQQLKTQGVSTPAPAASLGAPRSMPRGE